MLQRESMLQRGAVPTVSSTAVELNNDWQNSLKDQWGDLLRGLVQLPNSPRGFFIYFAGLTVVCGALAIYILLSVQIRDAQLEMVRLENELARIEQTNSELIYQMAQKTSMAQMNQRALDEGYVHNVQRLYVPLPSAVTAAQFAASAGEPQLSPASAASVNEGDGSTPPAVEPAVLASEMGQTVGAATAAATGFLTVQGGRAADSMMVQGERFTVWAAPYWERVNEFMTDQWARIEQSLNR